jgi:EAL domain-containing protein (putative c-di-GMP-specific phosphodiesterase class I)
VGINLSPRQFLEPDLFDKIQRAVVLSGVNPAHIELEITESLAMQDPANAILLLGRLRETGLKIALDDFGIGHSSLEYLLRFPIDAIKIDRAFVTNITHVQADRVIVRAVTAIGQTMGLSVIAEGVETLRQCDFIEALGVTEIQGYLIGKPMESAQIETLIANFVRPGAETPTN